MIKILYLVFIFIVFSSLNANEKLETVNLQLKWKNQFQFAGFIVAKEKGYYKELGLDVNIKEFDNSELDVLKDMESGKTQFAVSSSYLVLEYLKGKPVVGLFPIYQSSPYIFVSLNSSNIKSLRDLNSKKIAIYDDINSMELKSMLHAHNINYIQKKVPDKFHALLNGQVDSIIAYESNEPFLAKEMGLDVNVINPNDYGFERMGDILFTSTDMVKNRPETVEKMYQASKRGFEYAFDNIDETVDLIYKQYNEQNKSKASLRYEAEVLKKLSGFEKSFASFNIDKIKSVAYIYSFMEAGHYDFKHINNFIYQPKNNIYIKSYKKFELNKQEKEYLEKKESISMCYPINNAPFTMVENNEPVGIGPEFIKLIEQKIDKKIEYKYVKDLKEQFQMAAKGECESVPLMLTSPQIVPYLVTTKPVAKDKLILVTKIDEQYLFDISKLKDKKIGVNANAVNVIEYLDRHYPYFDYVKLASTDLDKVLSGELYGFIGLSISLNYAISVKYRDSLKVMTTFDNSEVEGSVGVNASDPLLLSILNKAIDSIDFEEKENAIKKWIDIQYKEVVDYTMVYSIIIIATIILGLILYANRRLLKEINDRKLVEKKLKESEEKLRTLFDIVPVMLDAFDENGKCILWNKECERVFGWTIDEINEYENTIGLFYPDEKVQKEVIKAFSSKDQNAFKEWHPIAKSGEKLVNLWANVFLPNGEVISVGIDITKQRATELEAKNKTQQVKEARDELKKLNLELESIVKKELEKSRQKDMLLQQQSKMASMGEMIENIAHQWRQPLAQINSAILIADTIIRQSGFYNDKVEEKLLEVESLTEYMSKTISDFRNFFSPHKQKFSFLLYKAVEESLLIVDASLKPLNIKVIKNLDMNYTSIGYQNELQQVIVVILNNARDILIARDVHEPKIFINMYKTDEYYTIEICDNGGGIDESIIDKVFDPYFTTKHKSRGTGLGLYMAKMIIEDGLDGKLLASNKDEGSCFKILLKVVSDGQ